MQPTVFKSDSPLNQKNEFLKSYLELEESIIKLKIVFADSCKNGATPGNSTEMECISEQVEELRRLILLDGPIDAIFDHANQLWSVVNMAALRVPTDQRQ